MNQPFFHTTVQSPLGLLTLTSNGEALTGLYIPRNRPSFTHHAAIENAQPFREAIRQLNDYFAGKRLNFDLPLAPHGTDFQRRVWQALQTIPYGQTVSYIHIAKQLGMPSAPRAVGNANGRNPIAIIIPCHRVIASDGGLGGYTGGLDIKEWLLHLEAATPQTRAA